MPLRTPACLLLAAFALSASAQQGDTSPRSGKQDAQLKPIEQGVEDENQLRSSLRKQLIDMRAPSNWDRVYRVNQGLELYPGAKRNGSQLVRASGALMAVFRESTYRPVAPGVALATIPAGTVWVLGDPNAMTQPQFVQSRSTYSPPSLLADQLSDLPPDQPITRVISQVISDSRTIWTSDIYRQQRIASLLDDAATD